MIYTFRLDVRDSCSKAFGIKNVNFPHMQATTERSMSPDCFQVFLSTAGNNQPVHFFLPREEEFA